MHHWLPRFSRTPLWPSPGKVHKWFAWHTDTHGKSGKSVKSFKHVRKLLCKRRTANSPISCQRGEDPLASDPSSLIRSCHKNTALTLSATAPDVVKCLCNYVFSNRFAKVQETWAWSLAGTEEHKEPRSCPSDGPCSLRPCAPKPTASPCCSKQLTTRMHAAYGRAYGICGDHCQSYRDNVAFSLSVWPFGPRSP